MESFAKKISACSDNGTRWDNWREYATFLFLSRGCTCAYLSLFFGTVFKFYSNMENATKKEVVYLLFVLLYFNFGTAVMKSLATKLQLKSSNNGNKINGIKCKFIVCLLVLYSFRKRFRLINAAILCILFNAACADLCFLQYDVSLKCFSLFNFHLICCDVQQIQCYHKCDTHSG